MRKTLIAVVLLAACAKNDAAKTDTTAATQAGAAAAPATPAPPRALTAADVAGKWNGESKPEGKDSVTGKWTITSTSDSTGKLTFADAKGSVDYSSKLDADSLIATSKAYNDPQLPKGSPKVIFKSIGRLQNGALAGTATLHLASKPDSVLGKVTWTATKAP